MAQLGGRAETAPAGFACGVSWRSSLRTPVVVRGFAHVHDVGRAAPDRNRSTCRCATHPRHARSASRRGRAARRWRSPGPRAIRPLRRPSTLPAAAPAPAGRRPSCSPRLPASLRRRRLPPRRRSQPGRPVASPRCPRRRRPRCRSPRRSSHRYRRLRPWRPRPRLRPAAGLGGGRPDSARIDRGPLRSNPEPRNSCAAAVADCSSSKTPATMRVMSTPFATRGSRVPKAAESMQFSVDALRSGASIGSHPELHVGMHLRHCEGRRAGWKIAMGGPLENGLSCRSTSPTGRDRVLDCPGTAAALPQ